MSELSKMDEENILEEFAHEANSLQQRCTQLNVLIKTHNHCLNENQKLLGTVKSENKKLESNIILHKKQAKIFENALQSFKDSRMFWKQNYFNLKKIILEEVNSLLKYKNRYEETIKLYQDKLNRIEKSSLAVNHDIIRKKLKQQNLEIEIMTAKINSIKKAHFEYKNMSKKIYYSTFVNFAKYCLQKSKDHAMIFELKNRIKNKENRVNNLRAERDELLQRFNENKNKTNLCGYITLEMEEIRTKSFLVLNFGCSKIPTLRLPELQQDIARSIGTGYNTEQHLGSHSRNILTNIYDDLKLQNKKVQFNEYDLNVNDSINIKESLNITNTNVHEDTEFICMKRKNQNQEEQNKNSYQTYNQYENNNNFEHSKIRILSDKKLNAEETMQILKSNKVIANSEIVRNNEAIFKKINNNDTLNAILTKEKEVVEDYSFNKKEKNNDSKSPKRHENDENEKQVSSDLNQQENNVFKEVEDTLQSSCSMNDKSFPITNISNSGLKSCENSLTYSKNIVNESNKTITETKDVEMDMQQNKSKFVNMKTVSETTILENKSKITSSPKTNVFSQESQVLSYPSQNIFDRASTEIESPVTSKCDNILKDYFNMFGRNLLYSSTPQKESEHKKEESSNKGAFAFEPESSALKLFTDGGTQNKNENNNTHKSFFNFNKPEKKKNNTSLFKFY